MRTKEIASRRKVVYMTVGLALGELVTACSSPKPATSPQRPVATTAPADIAPTTGVTQPQETEERADTGVTCTELATNPNDAGERTRHRWHAVESLSTTPEYNSFDLTQALGANALATEAESCHLPDVAALYTADGLQLSGGIPADKVGDAIDCAFSAQSDPELDYCVDSLKN